MPENRDSPVKFEAQTTDLSLFNTIAAIAMIAFSVFALLYLIPYHVPIPAGLDQGLSARFMPRLAAIGVGILALLLLLNVLNRKRKGLGALAEDNEDNELQVFGMHELSNAAILAVGSAVYVVGLHYFGFVIASGAALAVCMFIGGVRNIFVMAGICVAFPYAMKILFWQALTILLPQGTLF